MGDSDLLAPVKFFCSYSHADENLLEELEAHLSPFKRLGQIKIWHDRRIGPGDEWKKQLDSNLEDSEIIALLISSDFINSQYCYEVEAKSALQKHRDGQAAVIPIMLRPVEFSGLPFADLQMLPRNAIPITSWGSRDEAFKDVASGIQVAIDKVFENRKLRLLKAPGNAKPVVENRALDAAIAAQIPIGEFREVVSTVRLLESEGLTFTLSKKLGDTRSGSSYSCRPSEVRSECFDARYSLSATGELTSAEYRLTISAPDLEVEGGEKKFSLVPRRDSTTFKFLIKAAIEGEYRLRVNLFSRDWSVAETLIVTEAAQHGPSGGTGRPPGGLRASVELVVRAFAKAASSAIS